MEIIKDLIHSHQKTRTAGFDIIVRCIEDGEIKSKNTLVKKSFQIKDGKKIYSKHRGLNLSDLAIIKTNWSKILKAMVK